MRVDYSSSSNYGPSVNFSGFWQWQGNLKTDFTERQLRCLAQYNHAKQLAIQNGDSFLIKNSGSNPVSQKFSSYPYPDIRNVIGYKYPGKFEIKQIGSDWKLRIYTTAQNYTDIDWAIGWVVYTHQLGLHISNDLPTQPWTSLKYALGKTTEIGGVKKAWPFDKSFLNFTGPVFYPDAANDVEPAPKLFESQSAFNSKHLGQSLEKPCNSCEQCTVDGFLNTDNITSQYTYYNGDIWDDYPAFFSPIDPINQTGQETPVLMLSNLINTNLKSQLCKRLKKQQEKDAESAYLWEFYLPFGAAGDLSYQFEKFENGAVSKNPFDPQYVTASATLTLTIDE